MHLPQDVSLLNLSIYLSRIDSRDSKTLTTQHHATKKLQIAHFIYMSDPHPQGRDVHNIGPIILICEAENEDPNKNIKVVIHSKTVCKHL